jgi:heat shock protein HslJ
MRRSSGRTVLVLGLAACAPAAPPASGGPDSTDAAGPWDAATAEGFAFRGIGQEPGWTVDIAPGRAMRAVLDYGERTLVTGAPAVSRDGPRTVYTGTSGATAVRVAIERTPCADAMSGERMSHAVTLVVDGRELRGCGRMLPVSGGARVEGTWRLEELDGRPVVGGGGMDAPYLRIDGAEGRATGSTGCNSFGGEVGIAGDRIDFGVLAMTRRACVDEGMMDQERRFTAALEAADRYRTEGDMLVLLRGDAALARFTAMDPPPRE